MEKEFEADGRKIPLKRIRKKIYSDHKKFGIMRDSERLNRYLIVWADHASILNSGHLLLTIKVIYSPTLFFTNQEMKEKTGKKVDVQSLVERPSVYILLSDTAWDKLTYVQTRLDDVKDLREPLLLDGITIHDTIRFFHGMKFSIMSMLFVVLDSFLSIFDSFFCTFDSTCLMFFNLNII